MTILNVTRVSPDHYVGSTTLGTIRGNCPDPKRVDRSTERERNADPDMSRAHGQRGDNQRKFTKSRITRAIAYGRYIAEVDSGKRLGGYPPITLWTKEEGEFIEPTGVLILPASAILTANDGETQLAARYIQAGQDPTQLDKPFAFTLVTSSTKKNAAQTLHDMNFFGVNVSEKETAALNIEGPLTIRVNEGITASGRDASLTIKPRSEKVTGNYLTTQSLLLVGSLGALHGPDAMRHTPTSLIKKDNGQFTDLGDQGKIVSKFVAGILSLPDNDLRRIDGAHMMTLGAIYNRMEETPKPLPADAIETIDQALRAERGGRRATVQHRARAMFDFAWN